MKKLVLLSLVSTLFLSNLFAQNRTLVATDPFVYAVSYIEVTPASRSMAVTAFKQYSEASRKDGGYNSVGVFEQIGRPAHFVIVEKWADQKAFDAHAAADSSKQLMARSESFRLGFDRQILRTVSTAEAPRPNDRAVVVVTHVDTAGPQVDAPALLRKLAENSRKEKGNVRFDVLQNAMRLNHFTIVEAWQGQDAVDAHALTAQTREYRNTIQPVLGSPLDERLFKAVD
jgi:quinol monooxygenase YgiN